MGKYSDQFRSLGAGESEIRDTANRGYAARFRALEEFDERISKAAEAPEGGTSTPQQPKKPRSTWEKILGIPDAALTIGTGMASGLMGAGAGILDNMLSGTWGTREGTQLAERTAGRVMERNTWTPRTEAGREYAETVGRALNDSGIVAVAPMMDVVGAVPHGVQAQLAAQFGRLRGRAPSVRAADIPPPEAPPNVGINPGGMPSSPGGAGATADAAAATSTGARIAELPGAGGAPTAPQPTVPAVRQAVTRAEREGRTVNTDALTRQERAGSLPVPIDLTRGQALQDPALISMERNLRSRNPALVERYGAQNRALQANVDQMRTTAAPDVMIENPTAAGQALVERMAGRQAERAAETSAAYQALRDANAGALPLDGATFGAEAGRALESNMKGAFLPSSVQSIVEQFASGKRAMTFENFENLRTILASEARKAQRSGDGNAAAAIRSVRDTLENMPISSEVAEVKALADRARALARAEFAREEAMAGYGEVAAGSAAADTFVQRHFINRRDTKAVARELADLDPESQQIVRAEVINHLQRQGTDSSRNFNSSGYNRALNALGTRLDAIFPAEQAAQLRAIGQVARDIDAQPKGAWVNNSNTSVAELAREGLASSVEAAANAKTGGIGGTIMRGKFSDMLNRKRLARENEAILGPGAGIVGESTAKARRGGAPVLPAVTTPAQSSGAMRERQKADQ
ncbi:MAG: hypothetical protein IT325_09900 [Anaerolineae bacterium]|nr:hypothetical protein [Anaerolineae bacterium]